MKVKGFLLLIAFISTFNANAQLSQSQIQKIDSLFLAWTAPNHPGGAVGVMQNGKTVFSKAYGLASLEYQVENTPETQFNIASVSKQFTAIGIVLLHLEGKLSINDNIRKHLPEMPEFMDKITIRHMLHHTSGLRSLHAILGLAGWRNDDSRSNEDLNRFMIRQEALNFNPGDEYMYCNTGYMFMATIIERITKESFPEWMKQSVFEPLGMKNTYVEDQYYRVVENNATSYYTQGSGGYARGIEYWNYVGSGNIHSTTHDMLVWLENFRKPKEGWKKAFEMLETMDPFNDGSENNYAFGVIVDKFQGAKRIQHGGAIGGFRSGIYTFPEEALSIAVLSNFSSPLSEPNKIAELLLPKIEVETSTANNFSPTPSQTITLSTKKLEKFTASYWNDISNYVRKIYVKDDTLRYFRSASRISPLVPISNNEFQMLGVQARLIVTFELNSEGNKCMQVKINDNPSIQMDSFESQDDPEKTLPSYAGSYYSPEIETSYVLYLDDDTLKTHHPRHGDHPLRFLKKDVLAGNYPLNNIKFKRDENGVIEGIFVSNDRVRNLWFKKR